MFFKYKVTFKITCMPIHEHFCKPYLHGSSSFSRFANFSYSAFVGRARLCLCWDSVVCSASLLRLTRLIISRVEFHRVGTSCKSGSWACPREACWAFSSSELAGLCLKCPTTLRHLASAPSKPPSRSDITIALYHMRNTGQMLEWKYPPCCHHIRSAVCSNSAHFVSSPPLISDVEKLPGTRSCKVTILCFHHT